MAGKHKLGVGVGFRGVGPGLVAAVLIIAVAGCRSDDSAAVLDPGQEAKPPQQMVRESDLRGFCPSVTIRSGTAYFNSYAKGGQDDPQKVRYQASISDVTRDCSRSQGMLSITVAVAGRVVPGPAGLQEGVTLPIRVAMVQGDAVLQSELQQHTVTVADNSAATQFVYNAPTVTIPEPSQRNIQIFVGFDEGSPKKTAATE